jgi:hypothetical protein
LAVAEKAEQVSVGRVVLTAGVTLAQDERVGEVIKPVVKDPFKRHVVQRRWALLASWSRLRLEYCPQLA